MYPIRSLTASSSRATLWPATQASPSVGIEQAAQQAQRGGFPRAVGADEAEDFAARDLDVEMVDRQSSSPKRRRQIERRE